MVLFIFYCYVFTLFVLSDLLIFLVLLISLDFQFRFTAELNDSILMALAFAAVLILAAFMMFFVGQSARYISH